MKKYSVVKVRPEDKKVSSLDTYDVMTVEDNKGVQYEVELGFYQFGESFRFYIEDYVTFNKYLSKLEFSDDYDIEDSYSIQMLIHQYEDDVVYKDY